MVVDCCKLQMIKKKREREREKKKKKKEAAKIDFEVRVCLFELEYSSCLSYYW